MKFAIVAAPKLENVAEKYIPTILVSTIEDSMTIVTRSDSFKTPFNVPTKPLQFTNTRSVSPYHR